MIALVIADVCNVYAFYDSKSEHNYNVITNDETDGYIVEFAGTYLLDVTIPSAVSYNGHD